MKHADFPSGIVPLAGPVTCIGNAVFGGRLRGTSGTGFSQFRVYGMYALVLLLDGGGRYRDRRGTDRRLSRGDLLVVFPESPHQYGPEVDDVWDEVFIAFKGAAFEGWRANGLTPSHPIWTLPNPMVVARRFFEILRMPSATLADSTAIATRIHQLVADLLEQRPRGREDWLEKARQLLGQGANAPELPDVASAVGMSYERFRKAFKDASGDTPAGFRRRQRLAQAALMLQRSDLSLEMIAESLGFCDGFHLSKAFKAEHGESPASFRRRICGGGILND